VLEVLQDENVLLRAENITLWDKVIELETKLARTLNNFSSSLKPSLSYIINLHQ
jgi:hypothetical protein